MRRIVVISLSVVLALVAAMPQPEAVRNNTESVNTDNTLEGMRRRRKELVDRRRKQQQFYYAWLSLCVLLFILTPIVFFLTTQGAMERVSLAPLLGLVYFATFASFLPMLRVRVRSVEEDIQALDFDIDLQQYPVHPRENPC